MKLLQYWRGLFLVFAALLLTGCIPNAEFKVTPQPLSAGQMATFDASASSPFLASRGNSLVSYAWDFGDGTKASGKVATHTYAKKGEYLVQLTVKDTQGLSDTRRLKLKVGEAVGSGQAKVLVRSAQGVLLGNAEVSIGGVAANSNAEGVADLSGVPAGDQVVVVKKAGFVTQAQQLKLVAGTPAQVQVLLQPVKEVKQIADIAAAQAILGETLGAQIVLPANAFVDAAGNPATGAVTLNWTPWDITQDDLLAMPGNGRALGADGQATDLISAGMMTVDFIDAQGKHLQLASGKKATIRMNLPFTKINGVDLVEGSEIPMWTFDEALGLWKEEGKGYVVASASSPTGLAVEAEVSHFSTWNWDFKFNNPNTLNVSCVDSADQAVACDVVVSVDADNGGHFTKSSHVPVGGVTIINMPSAGTANWVATSATGLIGSETSGLSGSVVIRIAPPLTSNFVRCQDTANQAVACSVTLSAVVDSTTVTREIYVPVDGALIQTSWNTTSLEWSGESELVLNGTQWSRYTGTTTSGASGDVNLKLDNQIVVPADQQFKTFCTAKEWDGTKPSMCNIVVTLMKRYYDERPQAMAKLVVQSDIKIEFKNVPIGQIVNFGIPADQFRYVGISATYEPDNGNYQGWASFNPDENEYGEDPIEVPIGVILY